MADISIADVRAKYPQYHDLSDDQLAQGLHQKFYADMPFEQFSAKIGLKNPAIAPAPKPEIPGQPGVESSNVLDPSTHPSAFPAPAGQGDIGAAAKQTVGLAEQIPAGIAGGVSAIHEALTGADPGSVHDLQFLQPHTEAGKDIQAKQGLTVQEQLNKIPSSPLADTLKERIPQALSAVGTVAGAGSLVRGRVAPFVPEETQAATTAAAPGPVNPIVGLQKAGYKFRPSDVQARNPTMTNVPGSTRESFTATPEQTQEITRHNSALSTKLIGEDIGVPDATKLTPEHYTEAMKKPGADYDRVGEAVATIEKPATNVAETLRTLADDQSVQAMPATARAQARRIAQGLESGKYTGPQVIKDISYFRDIPGAKAAANALEDELGAQVQAKAPTMSGVYEGARTLFAKIHNAQDATTGGLVDAADYRRLGENNPRLLTGNSLLVHQAGAELPAVTRLPTPTAAAAPVTEPTFFSTVSGAARAAAKKLPGVDITRPGTQAKIAAAAPAPGPLPVGPPQRGLPTVGQTALPIGPGGSPAALAPPPGPVPPRSPVRGPLGQQLAMQGPNADLAPPEGVTPAHRFKGPTGPQAEAELLPSILERPPGNAPGGFSVRGPLGEQLANQGPELKLEPPPGRAKHRSKARRPAADNGE